MNKPLTVRNVATNTVYEVSKYIKAEDGEVSIWCKDWYGRHIIGQDCEFTPACDTQAIYTDVEQVIIEWVLDGRKTAGSLTRDIITIIKRNL